jgi:acetyl esterase/lipase
MTKRVLLAAFALCVSRSASAQQPAPMPPIEQLYRMPVVYTVPGMDKVEVRRDIVYKTTEVKGAQTRLKFDAYLPADSKTHPVVVLISGGGAEGAPRDWRDAGVYQSYGRLLAASGLVAIPYTKRYARGPVGTANGAEDTRDLLAYVREHAGELHADKDRIALWAFSAGGLMLAPFLVDPPACVRAIACFYCVSDITQHSWDGVEGVSGEQVEQAARLFSSARQIQAASPGASVPPLFIGRAGLDSPGLNQSIDRLVREALEKNLSVELWNHPTGRHGFDTLDDNARSREMIRRAVEFLRSNLDGKP